MHLWPSMRIRDSFKKNYLNKLEWNLHRMNNDKHQQQNLLESGDNTDSQNSGCPKVGLVFRELLLVLSCCYCCFCCGACVDDEDMEGDVR